MPKLFIDNLCWLDRFFFRLSSSGKLLYLYCLCPPNPQAHGIHAITLVETRFHTKLPQRDINKLFVLFESQGKIKWMQSEHKIWVKDYILTQTMNPSCAVKLKACLRAEPPALIKEYVDYYNDMGYWTAHHIDMADIFDPPKPKPKKNRKP